SRPAAVAVPPLRAALPILGPGAVDGSVLSWRRSRGGWGGLPEAVAGGDGDGAVRWRGRFGAAIRLFRPWRRCQSPATDDLARRVADAAIGRPRRRSARASRSGRAP